MNQTTALVERELYAELGELAGAFIEESRRHTGEIRNELARAAAQLRLIRQLYWDGSISSLAALDWLGCGRSLLESMSWSRL